MFDGGGGRPTTGSRSNGTGSASTGPTSSPSSRATSTTTAAAMPSTPAESTAGRAAGRPSRPTNRPGRKRPGYRPPVVTSTTSTTTAAPNSAEDYQTPTDLLPYLNLTLPPLDLTGVREWNSSTELTVLDDENGTMTVRPELDAGNGQAPVNCSQSEPEPIDPSRLFQFAQRLEQAGYENYTSTLKGLCWETSFGQELVKLTLTDLYMNIISTIFNDYLRAVFVRYCNGWPCICCDLEMRFPGYPDFAIAENILSLVNSQGLIW